MTSTKRERILADLAVLLADMPMMRESASRHLFAHAVQGRLGPRVKVRGLQEPQRQSEELLAMCSGLPGGPKVLVDVLAEFTPPPAQLSQFQRLLNELDAVDVLAEEDWSELAALRSYLPQNPSWLYQRATQHQLASPPGWCNSAWDMFIHLCGQNAPSSGLPPGMVFLLLLEYEVDSSLALRIYRRNQRMASMLGLTAELDERRGALNRYRDQPANPYVYLIIQIEPDQEPERDAEAMAAEGERYVVSQYRQWYGDGCWHSRQHGKIRGVIGAALEPVAEQIVQETEEDWHGRSEFMGIEFVLPVHLLNSDVAWWCRQPGSQADSPLVRNHPVVVRSLERIRDKGLHHAWRQRWARLWKDPLRNRLYWSRPDVADLARLEAELSLDPSWTALLLSEPPTTDPSTPGTGVEEIVTALRAGLPVVVWHRSQPSTDAVWKDLQHIAADRQIAHLPARLHEARLDWLRSTSDYRPVHVARHLALLWDDPERMPEPNRADDAGVRVDAW